jgi:hypothetical protein
VRSLSLRFGAVIVIMLAASGCAANRVTAIVDPSADLASIDSMHVTKFEEDQREIDLLIADRLELMGYAVTTGDQIPAGADAVVTYIDKWFWDITMYMLELTITIREPGSNYPLASGNSFHTSLTRLSSEEMVEEVLTNIFSEPED